MFLWKHLNFWFHIWHILCIVNGCFGFEWMYAYTQWHLSFSQWQFIIYLEFCCFSHNICIPSAKMNGSIFLQDKSTKHTVKSKNNLNEVTQQRCIRTTTKSTHHWEKNDVRVLNWKKQKPIVKEVNFFMQRLRHDVQSLFSKLTFKLIEIENGKKHFLIGLDLWL